MMVCGTAGVTFNGKSKANGEEINLSKHHIIGIYNEFAFWGRKQKF